MKNNIWSKIIVLTVILAIVLTGCSRNGSERKEKEKVIINYAGSYSNAVMCIIKNEKLMEKYLPDETEVEWTGIAAASEMRDGLISGAIDIAAYATPTYIIGEKNGLNLSMISAQGGTPIKLYTNDKNKKTLSDFGNQDKVSVVGLGTILQIAMYAQIEEDGLDFGDFENIWTVMPHADGLAAIKSNEINGLVLTFPMSLKADSDEKIYEVADFTDVINQYGIETVNVCTDELYEDYPYIVEAFKKAQEEAIKLYKENPEYFAKVLADDWDIDVSIVLDTLTKMPPEIKIKGYNEQIELLKKIGIIEGEATKFEQLDNYKDLK